MSVFLVALPTSLTSLLFVFSLAGRMTQSVVTMNGVNVASEQSPATHIHVHIHQESALAQLKGLCAGLQNAGPPKASLPYRRLALGVSVGWRGG